MKYWKLLVGLGAVLIIAAILYCYKLRSLALEGNKIFGERCVNVNPPLIAYKNNFLSFSDALKNPKKYSTEEIIKFYMGYIDNMQKYVPEDTKWLVNNRKFMETRDVKLFMPWYLKQGADLQQKMYEGYRDDAKLLLEVIANKKMSDDLNNKFKEARDRRDKYTNEYFDFNDNAYKVIDWRMKFMNLPSPKECTPENTFIPNTNGALDPDPAQVPAEKTDITG